MFQWLKSLFSRRSNNIPDSFSVYEKEYLTEYHKHELANEAFDAYYAANAKSIFYNDELEARAANGNKLSAELLDTSDK